MLWTLLLSHISVFRKMSLEIEIKSDSIFKPLLIPDNLISMAS